MKKRIGLLFGMEDTFPWALINAINARGGDRVLAMPVEVSYVKDDGVFDYDLILDRISHEIPFYRTFVKCAAGCGVRIVNNPIWWSADDKFFDNLVAKSVDVAVPRTVLLPHKQYPPNTEAKSFRNMRWVNWEEVFDFVKFPIFMKPAYGGGWKDVYKCNNPQEFFAAYDPKQPHHLRYVQNPAPVSEQFDARLRRDAIALCDALGYDMNTVELAVRDGVPYAIDFMNCAPDADRNSVGEANFEWVVTNMAETLIEIVEGDRPFELTGSWPRTMRVSS